MNIELEKNKFISPIYQIDSAVNNIYIKRDDLIPFSFGGNKARKAELFFQEIIKGNYGCVVTYGTSHSNLCRVVANKCTSLGLPCYIVCPKQVSDTTFNSKLVKILGAKLIVTDIDKVSDTIDSTMEKLRKLGLKPYFIPGGGHGNIGTQAYVDCYNEIKLYEQEESIIFDYIFFPSGTGTTQAGLVAGMLRAKDDKQIVGISVARKNPRGRNIVIDSVKEYLPEFSQDQIDSNVIFLDDYVGDGYGKNDTSKIMKEVFSKYGIPLDSTYTSKAYCGMMEYINKNNINNKNILFIHTGGTPLFFDDIYKIEED